MSIALMMFLAFVVVTLVQLALDRADRQRGLGRPDSSGPAVHPPAAYVRLLAVGR